MEISFSNQQKTIRTIGHVLWTMQFTKNISKDNEQYFLGVTP